MQVLIADDHPLFRAALRQALLQALPDAEAVEAHDVPSLRAAATAAEPELVLLDLMMPGGRSFAPLVWLRNQFPGTAVMIVSANEDPEVIRQARAFGAAGYVPKSAAPAELIDAIRAVAGCGQWFPAAADSPMQRGAGTEPSLPQRLGSLTPQQYRVLELVANGMLNKQIAADLGTSEKTIKVHRGRVMRKLEAESVAELVRLAQVAGVTEA